MCVFSFLVAAGFEPMYFSLGSGHLNHYPILTPQTIHGVHDHADCIFERSPIGMRYWNVHDCLNGHNTQHSGHTDQSFQYELMVEIYSKSLVRATGKVLLINVS